jgi:filamentous hemagglutinin
LTAGALDIAQIPAVGPGAGFGENLIHGAQTNLIKAAIKVGVTTVIEGAPLDQTLLAALRMAAADTIGAAVAVEIGTAAKTGQINTAAQLIAHAALGCATGAIASGDCAGGAAGGVAGEITTQLMLAGWAEGELRRLQSLNDVEWTQERIESELAAIESQYAQFRGQGINVAALAGGMASALTSGNANTGAMTGGNAANHNALPIAIGIIAEKLIAIAILAGGGYVAGQAIGETIVAINDAGGDEPGSTWPSNGGPPLDDDGTPNHNRPENNNPPPLAPPPVLGNADASYSVDDLLKPNGDFLGTVNQGATPNIRTVSSSEFAMEA